MGANVIEMVLRLRDQASPAIRGAGDAANQAGKQAKKSQKNWANVAAKLALVAAGAAVVKKAIGGMFTGSKKFIEVGAQMEGFETRLEVLMGSSKLAKDRLDELFKIGSTTPFELEELVQADITMESFGVNASTMRMGIMDLSGALGGDLASASMAVSKSFGAGVGASDQLRERYTLLFNDIKKRAAEMGDAKDIKVWQKAMTDALTDVNGVVAGGTAGLAKTFDGMISNLSDSWFKFQKDVADFGAFNVAKEILRTMLDLIGKNAEMSTRWAKVISGGVVEGMLLAMEALGAIMVTTNVFIRTWKLGGVAIDQIIIKFESMLRGVKNIGLAIKEFTGTLTEQDKAFQGTAILNSYKRSGEARERIKEVMFGELDILDKELVKQRQIGAEVDRIRKNMASIIAGPAADEDDEGKPKEKEKAPGPSKADIKAQEKARKDAAKAAAKQAEARDDMLLSLDEMNASMRALPFEMAAGVLDGMASPVQAITSAMGSAGPVLSSLAAMGAKGAKAIKAELKGFINNIITALVDVLPDILVDLPTILIDAVPRLVAGFIEATPKLVSAMAIQLPIAIFKGVTMWFVKAWKTIKTALAEVSPFKKKGGIFTPQRAAGRVRLAAATLGASEVIRGAKGLVKGSMQTGGFVSDTGLHMLHAGERVVPSTGASTSAMQAAAGNIGSGQAITINTNVVDPNALESLGRLLDRQFGEKGRSRAGIFSNAEPLAGLI